MNTRHGVWVNLLNADNWGVRIAPKGQPARPALIQAKRFTDSDGQLVRFANHSVMTMG